MQFDRSRLVASGIATSSGLIQNQVIGTSAQEYGVKGPKDRGYIYGHNEKSANKKNFGENYFN